TARSRTALQETRDPAHRCSTFQEGRAAALARCDAGIRGLGKADGSAAAARALRKSCGAMTMRYWRRTLRATRSNARSAREQFNPLQRIELHRLNDSEIVPDSH